MAKMENKSAAEYSLGKILSDALVAISAKQLEIDGCAFLKAILWIYNGVTYSQPMPAPVVEFMLDDHAVNETIRLVEEELQSLIPDRIARLKSPIIYLLDELICNIQQHARTRIGYRYIGYNELSDSIEIVLADEGITIYGSYVVAQRHLELIGNSDASALSLAHKGFSTKNLPNAENRGYGISSSMRIVGEGLKGEFAIFSGNALLVQFANRKEILSLPQMIDFKGTMVVMRFPAHLPEGFDLYKYIS